MNQITVTNRRVTQRLGGLLGGREISVRVDRISDVTIDTPAMGAIFNWGNVKIESSGSDEDDSDINHHGLANPKRLREVIFDLQDGKLNNPR